MSTLTCMALQIISHRGSAAVECLLLPEADAGSDECAGGAGTWRQHLTT